MVKTRSQAKEESTEAKMATAAEKAATDRLTDQNLGDDQEEARKPLDVKPKGTGQPVVPPGAIQDPRIESHIQFLTSRCDELEIRLKVSEDKSANLEDRIQGLDQAYARLERRYEKLQEFMETNLHEQRELASAYAILKERDEKRKPKSAISRIRPQNYDGSTELDIYLESFEEMASIHEWSDDDKAIMLRTHMTGLAAVLVSSASAKTYAAYVTALKEGLKESVEHYVSQLQVYKQKEGQTLSELAVDIVQLGKKAYGTQESRLKEMALRDAFIRALRDTSLKTKVRDSGPHNLQEAQEAAKKFTLNQSLAQQEAEGIAQPKAKVKEVKDKKGEALVKKIDALAAEFKKFKDSPKDAPNFSQASKGRDRGRGRGQPRGRGYNRPNNNSQSDQTQTRYQQTGYRTNRYRPPHILVCDRCGQTGHYAYECEAPVPLTKRTGLERSSENSTGQGPPPQPMSRN